MLGKVVHRNTWHWGRAHVIVLDKGRALCQLSVEHGNPSVAWLSNVIVHESVRGRGLGTQLLREVDAEAKRMGVDDIYLWTYLDGWPLDWYKRHGYEFSHLDLEDNVVLRKRLKHGCAAHN